MMKAVIRRSAALAAAALFLTGFPRLQALAADFTAAPRRLAAPAARAVTVRPASARLPKSLSQGSATAARPSRVAIGYAAVPKGEATDEFSPLFEAVRVPAAAAAARSAKSRKALKELSDEFTPLYDSVKDPATGKERIYFAGSEMAEAVAGGRRIRASSAAVNSGPVRASKRSSASGLLKPSARLAAAAFIPAMLASGASAAALHARPISYETFGKTIGAFVGGALGFAIAYFISRRLDPGEGEQGRAASMAKAAAVGIVAGVIMANLFCYLGGLIGAQY